MRDGEFERLGVLLTQTASVWRSRLDERLRPLDLSAGKWRTLAHLARAVTSSRKGNRRAGRNRGADPGRNSRSLTGRRLDQTKNHAGDRRCKTVHLQPRAATVLDHIFTTAHGLRHELLADIPRQDLQACVRVLARIREKALTPTTATRNGQQRAVARGRRA